MLATAAAVCLNSSADADAQAYYLDYADSQPVESYPPEMIIVDQQAVGSIAPATIIPDPQPQGSVALFAVGQQAAELVGSNIFDTQPFEVIYVSQQAVGSIAPATIIPDPQPHAVESQSFESDAPTLVGQVAPILVGSDAPTLVGQVAPILVGSDAPTLVGQVAPILVGSDAPTLFGSAPSPIYGSQAAESVAPGVFGSNIFSLHGYTGDVF